MRVEILPIFCHAPDVAFAGVYLLTVAPNLALRTVTLLVESRLFLFQLHDFVVKFRLFQKVGVARKDGHELGEIHACVLVHAVLVYAAHGDSAVVDLVDEKLFVAQEVELVSVQGLFRAIDDDVNHVAAPQLHGVAFAHRPTVALLQVGWAPGNL